MPHCNWLSWNLNRVPYLEGPYSQIYNLLPKITEMKDNWFLLSHFPDEEQSQEEMKLIAQRSCTSLVILRLATRFLHLSSSSINL